MQTVHPQRSLTGQQLYMDSKIAMSIETLGEAHAPPELPLVCWESWTHKPAVQSTSAGVWGPRVALRCYQG